MKILVIGSRGFIGSHCYEYFRNKGYETYGCDIFPDASNKNYFFIQPGSADYSTAFQHISFDACINASGSASVGLSLQYPEKDYELNVLNVKKILEAIQSFNPQCKFVNLSSAAVYGNPETLPIKETSRLQPISPYGKNKLSSEKVLKEYHEKYGIGTCSLRIFSAYGPGLKKQILWDIYQKAIQNNLVTLFGTGKESRDFIYISDIVRAIECIVLNAPFRAEPVNVASGFETTIEEVARLFIKYFNNKLTLSFTGVIKEGDPQNWVADISVLKNLGFVAAVNTEQGIASYIDWLKKDLL